MPLKTPGVYITAKNAFPNSVVEVATAVPAFIGYTRKAVDGSTSLTNKPRCISSLADYERCFGGAPDPVLSLQPAAAGAQAALPDLVAARGQETRLTLGHQDYLLTRAAGKAGGRFLMHHALRHFFQNGGGTCYIVSVGDYTADIAAGDEQSGLVGGITPLRKEQEPTLVVVPDAVLLSRADCAIVQTALLAHCGQDMGNRFAILDVWGGEHGPQYEKGNCIEAFRTDIGTRFLGFAAAYYPWLHTDLVQREDVDYSVFDSASRQRLGQLIASELKLADAAADDKKALAAKDVLADLVRDDTQQPQALQALADAAPPATAAHRRQVQASLMVLGTLYPKLMDEARALLNLVPPAAAMAGLYTLVDNTHGVWHAPANLTLAGVVAPAVDISVTDQADLHETVSGKSINPIRSFVGEGVLVWGARTLDGHSLDWRYINTRRTMSMLQETCRLATRAMAFEPNTPDTWVTIKSMIANYLIGVWKRGGLAGAVPEEAFSVHLGLGDTMTAEDILQGILRVNLHVAISRPAEFIEISLQQQMLQA